ncbi:hypothetical protein [Rossellomorea aquimaris]|jgi:hypothetical protein|uniref:hypothetical protein n=1 Tax=Rossellomorea aquimaris TaxID=189382 RepID=UPI0011E8FBAE|nr:hypothetical protein [Rossellomorea aquimaris]TYS90030.1 hypothetical protein FZC88_10665 [Rossellomorea aquimaris]
MSIIYIVGGKQKNRLAAEWHQYEKGVILKLDMETKQLIDRFEYVSPPEVCPDQDPSIVFKAGTVKEKTLYVCTEREVLVYSLPDMTPKGYVSIPCFNDVHHVLPAQNGNYHVVTTGLDMVVEVDKKGKLIHAWNVLQEAPWERFSKKVDYRKVLTTKPHLSHPNFVFHIGDEVWATRCLQKDAICLTNPDKRIDIGGAYIHDGVLFGDTLFFTRVDGHVVTVDAKTLKVINDYDLNEWTHHNKKIGWCRGIKILDDHTVIVGFTRMRPTKNPLDGHQAYQAHADTLPTRIACYDLRKGKLVWECGLERFEFNAVFSIHCENE